MLRPVRPVGLAFAAVSAVMGRRPFGGSMISDVRRSGLTRPRSNHRAL